MGVSDSDEDAGGCGASGWELGTANGGGGRGGGRGDESGSKDGEGGEGDGDGGRGEEFEAALGLGGVSSEPFMTKGKGKSGEGDWQSWADLQLIGA